MRDLLNGLLVVALLCAAGVYHALFFRWCRRPKTQRDFRKETADHIAEHLLAVHSKKRIKSLRRLEDADPAMHREVLARLKAARRIAKGGTDAT